MIPSISDYVIFKKAKSDKIKVLLEGALLPVYYSNLSVDWLSVWVQLMVIKQKPSSPSSIKPSDVVLLQVNTTTCKFCDTSFMCMDSFKS